MADTYKVNDEIHPRRISTIVDTLRRWDFAHHAFTTKDVVKISVFFLSPLPRTWRSSSSQNHESMFAPHGISRFKPCVFDAK